nr:Ig-like domain-containing protein [Butyrivibrio sp.]
MKKRLLALSLILSISFCNSGFAGDTSLTAYGAEEEMIQVIEAENTNISESSQEGIPEIIEYTEDEEETEYTGSEEETENLEDEEKTDSVSGNSLDESSESDNGDLDLISSEALNSDTETENTVESSFDDTVSVDGYDFTFEAESGVLPDGTSVQIVSADDKKDDINDTLPRTSTVKDGDYFDITFINDGESVEPEGNVDVSVTIPTSMKEEKDSSDSIDVQTYNLTGNTIGDQDSEYSDGVIEFDIDSSETIAIANILSIELSDIDVETNSVYEAETLNATTVSNQVLNASASDLLNLDNKKTSIADVALELKEQMKSRNSSVTINFDLGGLSDSSELSTAMSSALKEAYKHTGVATEGDYLRWAYSKYSMAYSYVKSGSNYVGQMYYTFTYNSTADQETAVDSKISSINSDLTLDGKTEAEKVYSIYSYITDNVAYDYDNLSDKSYLLKYSCYAAAVNNKAVCQGYSLLFYRLMLENGIDARLIAGEANGGSHGWNIVKIGSSYYNLDATWDAGKDSKEFDYFLQSDSGFKKHSRWNEYKTSSFNASYPMSSSDYDTSSLIATSVTDVKLDNTSLKIAVGDSKLLNASIKPDDASDDEVTWSTSDSSIAKVGEGGVVEAIGEGTCVITVKTNDGGYTDECYLTVSGKSTSKKIVLN